MDQEIIESNILIIADGLARAIPESDVIEAYKAAEFEMSDITLLLAAARIIYNDRKNAVPVRAVFKRVT